MELVVSSGSSSSNSSSGSSGGGGGGGRLTKRCATAPVNSSKNDGARDSAAKRFCESVDENESARGNGGLHLHSRQ